MPVCPVILCFCSPALSLQDKLSTLTLPGQISADTQLHRPFKKAAMMLMWPMKINAEQRIHPRTKVDEEKALDTVESVEAGGGATQSEKQPQPVDSVDGVSVDGVSVGGDSVGGVSVDGVSVGGVSVGGVSVGGVSVGGVSVDGVSVGGVSVGGV
ncbi:hypothetical protein EYF80_038134 [Liparis tanakae]|uniref:Uncharacterized protein n=1 Tax=Liparis tanakae TaxID=230148 RepID=A0A4Z2GG02_9TELE|nr:hypothetical protein EYF80_038134 [Liparis tanakae]